MVRRRTAAPKPSGPSRSYHAPPQRAPVPTPAAAPGAAPRQGPGLFGQMAATAGGVAIGSAVGHTIGNMMTGGGSSGSEHQPAQQAPQYQNAPPNQAPCEIEWRQFIECSQTTNDLGSCSAYNDLFKQCKARYNM